MRASLTLLAESPPIERVDADLAVAAFFADERPLRGDAGRIDWRLLGLLSRLLLEGRLTGAAGEAALLPSFGRLRAPRVLVLGLGARGDALEPERASDAAREATARGIRLGCGTLALSPAGLGASLPAPAAAEAVVRGALAALGRTPAELRLALVVPDAERGALRRFADPGRHGAIPVRVQTGPSQGAASPPAARPADTARARARRPYPPGSPASSWQNGP